MSNEATSLLYSHSVSQPVGQPDSRRAGELTRLVPTTRVQSILVKNVWPKLAANRGAIC